MAETTISAALCGVMEQALIEKGVDPTLAKALSQRACQPALDAAPSVAKKAVRKTRKGARTVVFERRMVSCDRARLKQMSPNLRRNFVERCES